MSALAVSIFRARLVTTEFVAYVCGRHLDKFLQQLHLIFYGLCTDQCLEHALPIALKTSTHEGPVTFIVVDWMRGHKYVASIIIC